MVAHTDYAYIVRRELNDPSNPGNMPGKSKIQ